MLRNVATILLVLFYACLLINFVPGQTGVQAETLTKDIYLETSGGLIAFGNSRIELRFAHTSASLSQVIDKATGLAVADATCTDAAPSDIGFKVDGNAVAGHLRYLSHDTMRTDASASLKLNSQMGDWEITLTYTMRPDCPIVERQVTLRNAGQKDFFVQGLSLNLPGILIGAPTECVYSIPMNFPPQERGFGELVPKRTMRTDNGEHSARFVIVHNRAKRTSLVAACYSEEEFGIGEVVENKESVTVRHQLRILWQAKPGAATSIGSQYICVAHGGPDDALKQAQQIYDVVNLRPPARTAEAAARTVIYSAHPGGTIDSHFRDVGGYKQFAEYLPALQRLGINTLWLLPIWLGPVYAPDDYYKLDPSLGTEDDLKALVDRAHQLGIKVLLDLIPHGPRDVSGLHKEHPDWISRDEKGDLLYWWGCLSCDYAHPGWQKYMAHHAAYWVKKMDVDGYRVDCAAGGPANYRPYGQNRASMSGLYGGMKLLEVARKTMETVKPDIFILPEAGGPFFFRSGDYVYDWAWGFKVAPAAITMPPEQWCPAAMRWLENEKLESPPGANYLRFLENHDTVRAEKLYGVGLHRAMMAVCAFIKGTPFLYHFQEIGYAPYLSKLYRIRAAYDELTLGEAFYQAAQCTAPSVFLVLRGLRHKWTCAAVNMSPEPIDCELSLPTQMMNVEPDAKYLLYDAFASKKLASKPFAGRELHRIPLRLDGYTPAVIVVRKETDADTAQWSDVQPVSFPPLPETYYPKVIEDQNNVRIENGLYTLTLAKDKGGLIRDLSLAGSQSRLIRATEFSEGPRKIRIGGGRFQLSQHHITAVHTRKTNEGLEVVLAGPNDGLTAHEVIYAADRSTNIRVTHRLTPASHIEDIRGTLASIFSFFPSDSSGGATHWFANTTEGLLYDEATQRHTAEVKTMGRSWHTGEALWTSGPLPLNDLSPWLGVLNEKTGDYLVFSHIRSSLAVVPQRLRVTDYLNGERGLHIVLGWLDNIRPVTMKAGKTVEFSYTIQVGRGTIADIQKMHPEIAPSASVRMKIYGARYVVENNHYRATLIRSRGGELRELVAKQPDAKPIILGSRIYTDYGLYPDYKDPRGRPVKTVATTTSDIEPETEILRGSDRVELRFRSFFRHPYGGGRSILRPLLEYRLEYVFDASPEIAVRCAVRPHFSIPDLNAFLAQTLSIAPMTHWAASGKDSLKQGQIGGPANRVWQSKVDGFRAESPFALFANEEEKQFVIVKPIVPPPDFANLFLYQGNEKHCTFFLAFFDGESPDRTLTLQPRWYEISYTLRPGIGTLKDALIYAEK